MLTHSLNIKPVAVTEVSLPSHQFFSDQFGLITGYVGAVVSEFTYNKDEEVFGEDEPCEYVYEVVSGAVRTYKLLSDGRRQIGAFHLPGDVFGLESGPTHRLTAEAIVDTTVRLVKRSQPRKGRRHRRPGGSRALGNHCRGIEARGRSHAATWSKERDGEGRELPVGDGPPSRRRRSDGPADVPSRHRGLSRTHA